MPHTSPSLAALLCALGLLFAVSACSDDEGSPAPAQTNGGTDTGDAQNAGTNDAAADSQQNNAEEDSTLEDSTDRPDDISDNNQTDTSPDLPRDTVDTPDTDTDADTADVGVSLLPLERWFSDDSVFNQPIAPIGSADHPGFETGTCTNDTSIVCTNDFECGGPDSNGGDIVRTNFCQNGRTPNFFKRAIGESGMGVGNTNGGIWSIYAAFGTPLHIGTTADSPLETVVCDNCTTRVSFRRLPGAEMGACAESGNDGAPCERQQDCMGADAICRFSTQVPMPSTTKVVQPDGTWAVVENIGRCANDHSIHCRIGNEVSTCPGSFCSYDRALFSSFQDRHMSVWMRDTGALFQFYQIEWFEQEQRWATRYGGMLNTTGDGFETPGDPPPRFGHGTAFGHGTSSLAIKTWELDAGIIDHALAINVGWSPCVMGWVPPAVTGSSNADSCSDTFGSPIGTKVQLDPEVDCDALAGISPDGITICRALQTYGAYIADWSLYPAVSVAMAEDVEAYHTVPLIDGNDAVESAGMFQRSRWKPLNQCSTSSCLTKAPLSRLRVMKMLPFDQWCTPNDPYRCWEQ